MAGKSSVLGRTAGKLNLSGWHTLHVAFDGSRVATRLQDPDGYTTKLIVDVSPLQNAASDGAVGLSAYNCGGVAFDTIQLSPFELKATGEPRFSGPVVSNAIWYASFLWLKTCIPQLLSNKKQESMYIKAAFPRPTGTLPGDATQ